VSRLVLIHWKKRDAAERARSLRAAGHTVKVAAPQGSPEMKPLLARPPDAFVIDLDHVPSKGRDMGLYIRQRKSTRHVPLVFAGGEREKVARFQKILPDAVFTEWRGIRGAIRKALTSAPADPVVRGAMEGYSGTPLPRKLGIKPGSRVALLGAPTGFEAKLGPLPPDVRLQTTARGDPDLILLFNKSKADLARRFPGAARALAQGGGIWITWPKQASGMKTDLTQNHVRKFGLDRDFVDYKICAIDETWSGLKFARRGGGRR
jgi:hypothetical protein